MSGQPSGSGGQGARRDTYVRHIERTRGAENASQNLYRDRAKERRERKGEDGIAFLANVSAEHSKFLGGDMEHTHLVKGLDLQLLRKVQAQNTEGNGMGDKEIQDEDLEAAVNRSGKTATRVDLLSGHEHSRQQAQDDALMVDDAFEPVIKLPLAKSIYRIAVEVPKEQAKERIQASQASSTTNPHLFLRNTGIGGYTSTAEKYLPGRMRYLYNLDVWDRGRDKDCVPLVVMYSKEETRHQMRAGVVMGVVGQDAAEKVSKICKLKERMEEYGKDRERGDGGKNKMKKGEKGKEGKQGNKGVEMKNDTPTNPSSSDASVDGDIDIFADAGDYVPSYAVTGKKDKESKDNQGVDETRKDDGINKGKMNLIGGLVDDMFATTDTSSPSTSTSATTASTAKAIMATEIGKKRGREEGEDMFDMFGPGPSSRLITTSRISTSTVSSGHERERDQGGSVSDYMSKLSTSADDEYAELFPTYYSGDHLGKQELKSMMAMADTSGGGKAGKGGKGGRTDMDDDLKDLQRETSMYMKKYGDRDKDVDEKAAKRAKILGIK